MFCLQACSTMGMRYNIFGNIDIEGETTVFSDWKINTVQVYGIGKRVLWFYFNLKPFTDLASQQKGPLIPEPTLPYRRNLYSKARQN